MFPESRSGERNGNLRVRSWGRGKRGLELVLGLVLGAVPEVENIYLALRSVVLKHGGEYVQNVFNG